MVDQLLNSSSSLAEMCIYPFCLRFWHFHVFPPALTTSNICAATSQKHLPKMITCYFNVHCVNTVVHNQNIPMSESGWDISKIDRLILFFLEANENI